MLPAAGGRQRRPPRLRVALLALGTGLPRAARERLGKRDRVLSQPRDNIARCHRSPARERRRLHALK